MLPHLQMFRGRSGSVMSVPGDDAREISSPSPYSPMTPDMATTPCTATGFNFNPRTRLLRRTSSTSTLGSIDDEDEVEWTTEEVERLTSVYERCVEEAALETPFSGVPPSQLLHNIARACRRIYRDDWVHSIAATRTRALALAREKEAASRQGASHIEATPRPADETDIDATPKRRRLRRNDSADDLPIMRNMSAISRLSDKLNQSSEYAPSIFFSNRIRSDTSSSLSGCKPTPAQHMPSMNRLARSMTFTHISSGEDAPVMLHGPTSSTASGSYMNHHPILRTASGSISTSSLSSAYPVRPGLYSAPSYAGSTESMRMHDEINSSIYGSSVASVASSCFTARSVSTAASSKPSIEHLGDDAAPFHRKRTFDHASAASNQTTPARQSRTPESSTPGSVPSISWSVGSDSSSRSALCESPPGTPSPSPRQPSHCTRMAHDNADQGEGSGTIFSAPAHSTTFLDHRYVQAGRGMRNIASWESLAEFAANPRKHGRDAAAEDGFGSALESSFEGNFFKKHCA